MPEKTEEKPKPEKKEPAPAPPAVKPVNLIGITPCIQPDTSVHKATQPQVNAPEVSNRDLG